MSYRLVQRHHFVNEHFIYTDVFMYRKFTLYIFDIHIPSLRKSRITYSNKTIVDNHLSTLNSKLTYRKVRH